MLIIYDEDRVEYIQLNVDIEEQRKRFFSKYVLNLVSFKIQTSKKSFDHHRIFMNFELLRDRSYSFFFSLF